MEVRVGTVDLIVEGEDAEVLSELMNIPEIEGGYGWRGLIPQAATARELKILDLKQRLDLRVVVRRRS